MSQDSKIPHGISDKPQGESFLNNDKNDKITPEKVQSELNNIDDTLGTKKYASSIADFIETANTPFTIGIQGSWGSGKTSLLNFIRMELMKTKKTQEIFINAWEHSMMRSPEEAMNSIVRYIIANIVSSSSSGIKLLKDFSLNVLSGVTSKYLFNNQPNSNNDNNKDELNNLFSNIKLGTFSRLKNELTSQIKTLREKGKIDRIVVFVDDLDRIEPKNAVKLIELLKNLFGLDYCVFVLAIDYEIVVRGLRDRFGDDKNDQSNNDSYKAFFDKIIQLSFKMPHGNFTIDQFISDQYNEIHGKLVINESSENAEEDSVNKIKEELKNIVTKTIGNNPRSIKRMFNTYRLLHVLSKKMDSEVHKNVDDEESADLDNDAVRLLVIALVCIQIEFPDIDPLLRNDFDFQNWSKKKWSKLVKTKNIEKDTIKESFIEQAGNNFENWKEALLEVCIHEYNYNIDKVLRLIDILEYINKNKDIKNLNDTDRESAFDFVKHTSIKSLDFVKNKTTKNSSSLVEIRRTHWKKFEEILLKLCPEYYEPNNNNFILNKLGDKKLIRGGMDLPSKVEVFKLNGNESYLNCYCSLNHKQAVCRAGLSFNNKDIVKILTNQKLNFDDFEFKHNIILDNPKWNSISLEIQIPEIKQNKPNHDDIAKRHVDLWQEVINKLLPRVMNLIQKNGNYNKS